MGRTRGEGGVLERLLLDSMVNTSNTMVNTVVEAMVGDSKDGLVDSMVDDWGWLGHWDDTAAHLTWKLHRDLPALGGAKLGGALFQRG